MLICRFGGFGRHTRLFKGGRIGSAGVAGGVGAIALSVSSFHGPKPGGGVAPGGGVVMMSGECGSGECPACYVPLRPLNDRSPSAPLKRWLRRLRHSEAAVRN